MLIKDPRHIFDYPDRLGNYRLLTDLGEGGSAYVRLGKHIFLGTGAAIKVLKTHLASRDVRRFHDEARTLASLSHPHIVRVLEYDVQNGVPFLVMEHAVHGNLREQMRHRGPLPASQIIPYVQQIASALQYIHNKRLIHRDIKPENILLNEKDEVLLSDFGIAVTISHTLAWPGETAMGTALYVAPEQIQSRPEAASDQYSLAVIVYEWLCGGCPFQGTADQVLLQHEWEDPPSMRMQVPGISPDMEAVVMKALSKAPQDRFPGVQAFAEALEQAYQAREAMILHPTETLTRTSSLRMPAIVLPGGTPKEHHLHTLAWSQFPRSTHLAIGHVGGMVTIWEPVDKLAQIVNSNI